MSGVFFNDLQNVMDIIQYVAQCKGADDKCKVPGDGTVSVQNFITCDLAHDTSTTTTCMGNRLLIKRSIIGPPSQPPHPGINGGVVSKSYCGPAKPISGSPDCFCESDAIVRLGDPTYQNVGSYMANATGEFVPGPESCAQAQLYIENYISGDVVEADPIDPVTGRMHTAPIVDAELPGPLPFRFSRTYSSEAAARDVGLGYGWSHTFSWAVELRARHTTVWTADGVSVRFDGHPDEDAVLHGPGGWALVAVQERLTLYADDNLKRTFVPTNASCTRYQLERVVDRYNNMLTVKHDGDRIREIEDSVGRRMTISTSADGSIADIALEGRHGRIIFARYQYDERCDLTSVSDGEGYVIHYTYDDRHLLTELRDPCGYAFHFAYDDEGRCTESWGRYPDREDPSLADGLATSLADGRTPTKGSHHVKIYYHGSGRSQCVDWRQRRHFSASDRGTQAVRPGGALSTTYDRHRRLVVHTASSGVTTEYEYGPLWNEMRLTDPLGRCTTHQRSRDGLRLKLVDASGAAYEMQRSEDGRSVCIANPLGEVTRYDHDERGLITAVTAPDGSATSWEYDAFGNCVAISRPGGATTRFEHDELARLVTVTSPLGVVTRLSYSSRGDLLKMESPSGTMRCTYDGCGRPTTIVNERGSVTRYEWCGLLRLHRRTDALGHVTEFHYDYDGNLVRQINEVGEVHDFMYDTGNRLAGERTYDGRLIRYTRDSAGRLAGCEDLQRRQVGIRYDKAGRIMSRTYDGDMQEHYEYDDTGRLMKCSNEEVCVTFSYDAAGRCVGETQQIDGEIFCLERTYDLLGRCVSRRTSRGYSEDIQRDDAGARTTTTIAGHFEIVHQFDAAGREVTVRLPEGGELRREFDDAGVCVTQRVNGRTATATTTSPSSRLDGAFYFERTYHYDDGPQLRRAIDGVAGSTFYDHDAVGRLIEVSDAAGTTTRYAYDAAGNRIGSARSDAAADRALHDADAVCRFDLRGNLVCKSPTRKQEAEGYAWRYEWAANNHLRAVTTPDGLRVEFAYDPWGRRLRKSVYRRDPRNQHWVLSTTARYYWDDQTLLQECTVNHHDPRKSLERCYCFADDGVTPIAHIEKCPDDGGGNDWHLFAYANDPVGAPAALLRPDGHVVWRADADPWGQADSRREYQNTTPLRLPGQYEDVETALHYNRSRYYDPSAGRYISPDPLGRWGEDNAYAYAQNDPLHRSDPFGLTSELEIAMKFISAGKKVMDFKAQTYDLHVDSWVDIATGKPLEQAIVKGLAMQAGLPPRDVYKIYKLARGAGSIQSVVAAGAAPGQVLFGLVGSTGGAALLVVAAAGAGYSGGQVINMFLDDMPGGNPVEEMFYRGERALRYNYPGLFDDNTSIQDAIEETEGRLYMMRRSGASPEEIAETEALYFKLKDLEEESQAAMAQVDEDVNQAMEEYEADVEKAEAEYAAACDEYDTAFARYENSTDEAEKARLRKELGLEDPPPPGSLSAKVDAAAAKKERLKDEAAGKKYTTRTAMRNRALAPLLAKLASILSGKDTFVNSGTADASGSSGNQGMTIEELQALADAEAQAQTGINQAPEPSPENIHNKAKNESYSPAHDGLKNIRNAEADRALFKIEQLRDQNLDPETYERALRALANEPGYGSLPIREVEASLPPYSPSEE